MKGLGCLNYWDNCVDWIIGAIEWLEQWNDQTDWTDRIYLMIEILYLMDDRLNKHDCTDWTGKNIRWMEFLDNLPDWNIEQTKLLDEQIDKKDGLIVQIWWFD